MNPTTESNTTKITLWVVGILVVAIGAFLYFTRDGANGNDGNATSTDDGSAIACTMDAKMCPDGSYVGRTGPKCEFAACPSATSTTGTKPTTSTGANTTGANTSGAVSYPADWAK